MAINTDVTPTVIFLQSVFRLNNLRYRVIFFTHNSKEQIRFYNEMVCVDIQKAVQIFNETKSQNNFIWQQQRKIRITASDCYSLFTYNSNENPDWPKKIKNYYKPFMGNKSTKLGKEKEGVAIVKYEKYTNNLVQKMGFVVNPSCPWMGASPDGYVLQEKIVIEVKTVVNEGRKDLQTAVSRFTTTTTSNDLNLKQKWYHRNDIKLKRKHKYYAQVQINMILLNATDCDFIIFDCATEDISIIYVEYDKDFTKILLKELLSVYIRHTLAYTYEHTTTDTDKQKLREIKSTNIWEENN